MKLKNYSVEIIECIVKNKTLVHADESGGFNAESEIALIKSKANYTPKFRVGCNDIYDKAQPWRILFQQQYKDIVVDHIRSLKGHILNEDPEFDKVMKEENLVEIMGNVRLIRINYEIKTITNGKDCEPCVCE